MGNNYSPPSAFPLVWCAGDCDNDWDCQGEMYCFQRSGTEAIPGGCTGSPLSSEDYCLSRPKPNYLIYKYDDTVPQSSSNYPLGLCQGDCDKDADCKEGLLCFQRDGLTQVPGCDGAGESGIDYCYDPNLNPIATPTNSPVANPVPTATVAPAGVRTSPPVPPGVTYIPGQATVFQAGLKLSTGLTARIIAEKGKPVKFDTGGVSGQNFHDAPDGAAVFADDATGGWIYASNSESSTRGGVGAITLDSQGRVVGYKHVLGLADNSLPRTLRNCGGGKTYWDTWLTCEEIDGGQVWEVDPWGNRFPKKTVLGRDGMNYESAAYDNRIPSRPTFYVTVDETAGPLVRFTPHPTLVSRCVADANQTYSYNNCSPMLYENSTPNHIYYHYFEVTSIVPGDRPGVSKGEYRWTTSLEDGRNSAKAHHLQGEGIDIKDGKLYYTTKASKYLFIINLDVDANNKLTFERSSTVSGAFDNQPDQVARVLDFETGITDGILYFCEDGGSSGDKQGVHGRDVDGKYFTILEDASPNFSGETTGLAFSPNGLYMYVAFQSPGYIYEIKRTDGYPFYGAMLDILHHADNNPNPFRRHLSGENEKVCELVSEMCTAHDP